MAEVLITLGIIGVVAAMTLPTIIQNYQKRALQSQFKKVYSVLSNAVVKSYADLGYEPTCSYIDGLHIGSTVENCIEMNNQMLANLGIIKKCDDHAYENGCIGPIKGLDTVRMENNPSWTSEQASESTSDDVRFRESYIRNSNPAYVLLDGSVLMLYHIGYPLYLVDVNGLKNPNKWGYDIFVFKIKNNRLQCHEYSYQKGGSTCRDMLLK